MILLGRLFKRNLQHWAIDEQEALTIYSISFDLMMEGTVKKAILMAMLIALSLGFTTGCYQTGKAAGKAVKGVEDGAKDLQKGYEQGKSGKGD